MASSGTARRNMPFQSLTLLLSKGAEWIRGERKKEATKRGC